MSIANPRAFGALRSKPADESLQRSSAGIAFHIGTQASRAVYKLEGFGFAAFLGAVVVGLLRIRVGLCDIGLACCSSLHGDVSSALWG